MGLEQIEKLSEVSDPRERMVQLVRNQAVTIAAEPSLFTVFFDQRPHLGDEHEAAIKAKERTYLEAFVKAVKDCGMLGGSDDARFAAHAVMGMTTWVYKWFQPGRDDPAQFAEVCVNLISPALRVTEAVAPS
jgi:hypothetical protein